MKKIIINEKQEKEIAKLLKEEVYQMPVDKKANKPYCINPEKVLIVKKFLDKSFKAHDYEKIGSSGMPIRIKVFSLNASNGEPLKYMYKDQLHDLLIDRFQNMFSDKIERSLFMKQVIDDWVNGSIGVFGNLSTNRLIAENISNEEIDIKASDVNPNPTEAQKEVGNYKMGHLRLFGMPITIETPKGFVRTYKDKNGEDGQITLKNHYGYFTNTSGNGKDGDAVDVFIGTYINGCENVFVIDQNNAQNEFDESKVMLGFKTAEDAKKAYHSNFSSDWKGFRTITTVSMDVFKKWLYRERKQRKPFSEYVFIQKKKLNENSELNSNLIKIITMPDEKGAFEIAEEINSYELYAYADGKNVYIEIENNDENISYVDDILHKCKGLIYDYVKTHYMSDNIESIKEELEK